MHVSSNSTEVVSFNSDILTVFKYVTDSYT